MMRSVVLCGFMGCGKTTVGELAAKRLGMDYVDADQYIVEKAGMTISEMFEKYGESYFRDREYEAMQALSQRKNTIISSGGIIKSIFTEEPSLEDVFIKSTSEVVEDDRA